MNATNSFSRRIDSPLGDLLAVVQNDVLVGVRFVEEPNPDIGSDGDHRVLDLVELELGEYFAGDRTTFSVPLAMNGSDFEHQVWNYLKAIPYGQTRSYGQQARAIGQPAAARAVGRANGLNPVAIIVPCHRVIGANGNLTGYAAGVERKRWLLQLEQRAVGQDLFAERSLVAAVE